MTEINRDLDTTPLPPNTLVAQDPQSAELAGYVRTKTFGRDVRESIARSIELNSTRSKNAENVASETLAVTETATSNMANQVELIRAEKDAVIANATVDSEVILARGGKATLGQRLDETTTDIDNRGIDIKKFGVKGDGTLETEAIQSALDSGQRIFWTDGTYYFSQLFIRNDNTHIVFSDNVVLKSDYQGDKLNLGAIEIKGERGVDYNLASDGIEGDFSISLSDVTGINEGDFLQLHQTDPTGTDLISHRQKWISCILNVRSVDVANNVVTFHESLPHSFQVSNWAKATKINPIRNVKIIGNQTLFDKMGTTEYANHFFVSEAHNLEIRGFHTRNGGGKGVAVYNTNTYKISDFEHRYPTNVRSGHGYGVQISNGSGYGIIERVRVYDSRHAIDFASGTHNCLVRDCDAYDSNYNGHGMNAKYITFEHCRAFNANFGMGNSSYLSDEKWKFINCQVFNKSGNITGFAINSQSFDVDIVNCEVNGCTTGILINAGSKRITINNVRIIKSTGFGIDFRSGDVRVNGLEIITNTDTALYFRTEAKNITLQNVSVKQGGTAIRAIHFNGASDIVMNNVKLQGDYNRGFQFTEDANRIELSGIDMDVTGTRGFDFLLGTINDVNVTIKNSPLIRNNQGTTILSEVGGITLLNNTIEKNMIFNNTTAGIVLVNNTFNSDSVTIKSTKDTLITNNYGVVTTFITPTNNDSDIIVKNNIIKTS